MAEPDLRERASELVWYHTLELAPGVTTSGVFDLRPFVDRYGLPERLDGKRVLDVGTFDGFWAFELERRGADVVALDIADDRERDWPPRRRPERLDLRPRETTFDFARRAFDSKVERVEVSIYHALPEELGQFDLVFCGSVLIHLRDQFLALERIANLSRDRLILAEEYSPAVGLLPFAAARFRAEREKEIVFWQPSVRGWARMIHAAGFDRVERKNRFKLQSSFGWSVRHVVFHAAHE